MFDWTERRQGCQQSDLIQIIFVRVLTICDLILVKSFTGVFINVRIYADCHRINFE